MRQYPILLIINLSMLFLVSLSSSATADPSTTKHINNNASAIRIQPGMRGWTELMEASVTGNLQAVKSLLAEGVDVNAQSKSGVTALTTAAYKGYLDIVRILLDNKADPNLTGRSGETPLLRAAKKGNLEIVKLLLKKGADANLVVQETGSHFTNRSPLETSVLHSKLTVFEILMNHTNLDKYGSETLVAAIFRGYPLVVEMLLDAGVSADAYINDRPIFTYAAERNQVEILSLLIKYGVNLKTKDVKRKEAAIYMAAHSGHTKIVELLIKAGEDVNTHTKSKTTLIDIAKSKKHNDVVALLRKYNAYESSPTIDNFLTSGILKLKDIFNLGNDDNYLEVKYGTAINVNDLGEYWTYEVGDNKRKSEWVYNGAEFTIVTPGFYVEEIEVTGPKYELTNGLSVKAHKREFIEKLGPPFKETINTIEYKTSGGDDSYRFNRRAVLTMDGRGYVLKINWFNDGWYISRH